MHIYEVLKRPVLTEKSTYLREQGQYVFEVDSRATKMLIREAVETTFDVEVVAVQVLNQPAKRRRHPRSRSKQIVRQSTWKKAIVQLAPNQKIDIFEGV
jgi:large subunit ribosomal protein L23